MIFPIVVALNWKDKTNLEQTLVPPKTTFFFFWEGPPKTTWIAIHQPVMPGRDTSIPQVRGLRENEDLCNRNTIYSSHFHTQKYIILMYQLLIEFKYFHMNLPISVPAFNF